MYRVLLIEANESDRTAISGMLSESDKFSVESATDAIRARKLLEGALGSSTFNICLLCCPLSGFEEPDFISWVTDTCPGTSIILIKSAASTEQFLCRCLAAGACDCLEKPLTADHLRKVIFQTCERKKSEEHKSSGTDLIAKNPVGGWVELTAPSEMEYLVRMRKFSDVLFTSRMPQEMCEDLRMTIDEAGRNCIEWGNRFDTEKKVRISYCMFDDRIVFKFEDEGEGFDPQKLMDPSKDPRAHMENRQQAGKRPGGYGVFLLKNLMDEVIFNEKGNSVVLTKFFPEKK